MPPFNSAFGDMKRWYCSLVLFRQEEDKLGEANKHLALLLQHASKDMKTHELAYELASRRNKPLLCLQV